MSKLYRKEVNDINKESQARFTSSFLKWLITFDLIFLKYKDLCKLTYYLIISKMCKK